MLSPVPQHAHSSPKDSFNPMVVETVLDRLSGSQNNINLQLRNGRGREELCVDRNVVM